MHKKLVLASRPILVFNQSYRYITILGHYFIYCVDYYFFDGVKTVQRNTRASNTSSTIHNNATVH